mmetsp:Transcript_4087/g.10500  ORF Transcript_4087/g.10500 Transcript_4087/m.10500 type:complete len:235 (+) Transcript_4087:2148-2852(+)
MTSPETRAPGQRHTHAHTQNQVLGMGPLLSVYVCTFIFLTICMILDMASSCELPRCDNWCTNANTVLSHTSTENRRMVSSFVCWNRMYASTRWPRSISTHLHNTPNDASMDCGVCSGNRSLRYDATADINCSSFMLISSLGARRLYDTISNPPPPSPCPSVGRSVWSAAPRCDTESSGPMADEDASSPPRWIIIELSVVSGRMAACACGCGCGCDGYMAGWMDKWMDGWINGCV